MANLSLKIKADFDEASRQFKALATESDLASLNLKNFGKELAKDHADKFIDRQEMAAVAMKATGRETEGLNSQVSAYQREIERLIKAGLDPQDESIQRLQAEYISLRERQEEAKLAAEAEAAAAKALVEAEKERAAALDKSAKETVELLTASSDQERQSIELRNRQRELKEEMERLIRSGISPQSEEVRRLQQEYERLGASVGQTERGMEMMATAAKASAAALAAVTAAAIASVQQTAVAGDRFAKASRQIGMTAETFQELEYAARQSGVSANSFQSSLQRLNRNIGDVRNGTGALTKMLGENNEALLNQLKNVNSNEQAFNLLMGAIKDAPNEFDRAALAYAAFGRAGQDMILMAKEGADGIAALREEARKFGIISNETAQASEEFMSAQDRLRAALGGVRNEMAAGMIPVITNVINKIADFISNIDNLKDRMMNIGIILAGVTTAISAFLVIGKLKGIIKGVAAAFKALTLAMKANPFGLIAVAVTLLITALILLRRNWDYVQTFIDQGVAGLVFAFQTAGSAIRMAWTVAFNAIRIALVTVLDLVHGNLLRTLGRMLDAVGSLVPAARTAANAINNIANSIGNLRAETEQNSREAIANANAERAAAQATHRERLDAINEEARARRAALRQREADNEAEHEAARAATMAAIEAVEKREFVISEILAKSLRERLIALGQTEAQMEAYRQDAFTQFMRARLDAEELEGEARIDFLRGQGPLILEQISKEHQNRIKAQAALNSALLEQQELLHVTLDENERLAIEKRIENLTAQNQQVLEIINNFDAEYLSAQSAFATMILAEEQKLSDARIAIRREEVSQMAGLFGSMSSLIKAAGRESRGAAIAGRALSTAQATINSFLAATNALATVPFPANIAAAASVLATGLAKKIRIFSTPLPSAETGGRFVVPNTTSRVDGVGLRVNPGERVDITPSGQAGGADSVIRIVINLGEQVLWDSMNKGMRAGELHEFAPAGNLQ